MVEFFRRLETGINPEIEIGRFLTEVAAFANTPALIGSVELVKGDNKTAIAIVHAFVQNQGDAWTVTWAYLDRFVDEQRLLAASERGAKATKKPRICGRCRRPDNASPRCSSHWRAAAN